MADIFDKEVGIDFELGFIDAVVIGGGGADGNGSYAEGFEAGKAEGFDKGREEGLEEGYQTGFGKGEEAGFDKGYADGKEDGLTEGEDIGYNKGYDEGEAFGKANAPTEDLSVTLTSNGTYSYSKPQDKYYDEVEVVVNVPSEKTPTQEKSVTIRENGTEEILPDSGYALHKVTVVTDIDTRLPEQEKSLEVTENKVYEVTPDEGYALAKVTVTGNVASSGGGDSGDDQLIKITTVSSMDGIFNSGLGYLFKSIDWTNFNKQQRTSLAYFFKGFRANTIDIANLDTSNVTNMSSMFEACIASSLNVKHFNTSKVTNMNTMFSSSEVTSLDLSGWNTSSLTNMQQMFNYCRYCHTINFDGWDTSSVTSIGGTFYNASNLKNVTFGNNWMSNAKVTSFEMNTCPLTKESILDLASKIADKSDTSVYTGTYTVKLKSSQKSLFTEEELTALANQFTAKNWTLAWS